MPHGTPDWAEMAPRKTVYGGIALDELAARLGSIVTFDRRGDVVDLDDFSNGANSWKLSSYGLLSGSEWSSERSHSGGFSIKLTGGSDDLELARANKKLALPPLSRVGVELSFAIDSNTDHISILLYFYTSTRAMVAEIKIDIANNKVTYRDSEGNEQDLVTSIGLLCNSYLFHRFKLVVDYISEVYIRLVIDNVQYSMEGLAFEAVASDILKYLDLIIDNYPRTGENDVVYIDSVIITQNEP